MFFWLLGGGGLPGFPLINRNFPRHGPDGREGIGGFACGACVEIMAPDFANYQEDLNVP